MISALFLCLHGSISDGFSLVSLSFDIFHLSFDNRHFLIYQHRQHYPFIAPTYLPIKHLVIIFSFDVLPRQWPKNSPVIHFAIPSHGYCRGLSLGARASQTLHDQWVIKEFGMNRHIQCVFLLLVMQVMQILLRTLLILIGRRGQWLHCPSFSEGCDLFVVHLYFILFHACE